MKKYSKGYYSGGQIMPGDIKIVTEKKAVGGMIGDDPTTKKKSNTPNFTSAEREELRTIKNESLDPNAYKKAVQQKIGFTPKKYPAGSNSSKDQDQKYNTAVNYINKGFRPVVKDDKTVGYKSTDSSTDEKYSAIKKAINPDPDRNKKLTKYVDSSGPGLAKGGLIGKIKMKKC